MFSYGLNIEVKEREAMPIQQELEEQTILQVCHCNAHSVDDSIAMERLFWEEYFQPPYVYIEA